MPKKKSTKGNKDTTYHKRKVDRVAGLDKKHWREQHDKKNIKKAKHLNKAEKDRKKALHKDKAVRFENGTWSKKLTISEYQSKEKNYKKWLKKQKVREKKDEEPIVFKEPRVDAEIIEKKRNICLTDQEFPSVAIDETLQNFYDTMTAVQAAVIPPLLEGKDAVVFWEAKSGKTLAFLIPAIEKCITEADNGTKAIVFVPSSKECRSVHRECCKLLSSHTEIIAQYLFGNPSEEVNTEAHITIATPGAFNNYITEGVITDEHLSSVHFCAVDEGDVLEEMGAFMVLKNIFTHLPPCEERQLVFISAKEHKDLDEFFEFKEDVVNLSSEEKQSNNFKSCHHEYLMTTTDKFLLQLKSLLLSLTEKKVLVFLPFLSMALYFRRLFYWNVGDGAALGGHAKLMHENGTLSFLGSSKGFMFAIPEVANAITNIDVVIWAIAPQKAEFYFEQIDRVERLSPKARSILLIRPFEKYIIDEINAIQPVEFSEITLNPAEEWNTVSMHCECRTQLTQSNRDYKDLPHLELFPGSM